MNADQYETEFVRYQHAQRVRQLNLYAKYLWWLGFATGLIIGLLAAVALRFMT